MTRSIQQVFNIMIDRCWKMYPHHRVIYYFKIEFFDIMMIWPEFWCIFMIFVTPDICHFRECRSDFVHFMGVPLKKFWGLVISGLFP